GRSAIGGGSLPGETLPSRVLAIESPDPDGLAARLRHAVPPVIGHIEDGLLLLDPRTVPPEQDGAFLNALASALS
ncbi:MAG: L-seryl-tRNA(Sec) selenium transferase, partial [SAR202 cluster bacterium]|nr:L-seryl-tRNA(Sec) selenium transferase [SAR202 cluster bacterium]